jgi:hypothetical protein
VPSIIPVLAWLFTALLLFMAVVCIAAGRGLIPVNHLIGIRFPPLQRDEAAWRAGHAAGVLPSLVAFAIALVCSLIGLVAPAADYGVLVAFVGGVVWVVVRAIRAADGIPPAI